MNFSHAIYLMASILLTMPLHSQPQTTTLTPEDLEAAAKPIYTCHDKALLDAPSDVTFGVADIKYIHGKFTIVECGNGPACTARAHSVFINSKECILTAPYWEIVSQVLKQYDLPAWFVGAPSPQQSSDALTEIQKNSFVRSFETLTELPNFMLPATRMRAKPKTISEHLGFVFQRITKRKKDTSEILNNFMQNYPEFLLVNAYSNEYFFSKPATYKLFEDAGLAEFIPRNVQYPVGYTKELAAKIIVDFPHTSRFVIKPLNQTLALGVSFVTADTLDAHLQHLFGNTPIGPNEEKSVGYWRTSSDSHFLVTEFASSQTIVYEDKVYEPTMRIIFLMTHETGTINASVLGGFWKLPPAALSDTKATPTDLYITNSQRYILYPGILIDHNDLAAMKNAVTPVLAKAYRTILLKASKTKIHVS